MKLFADDSIDSCVTDPPYELGFMGRHWDKARIAFDAAFWREVYRVLKPGAFVVAFGASRGYHRLACAIEDAGFEIRDSLMWLYGTGFPKSLNVQQAINKAARGTPQGGADPTSPNHGKFKGGCSEDNPQGRGFGAGAGAFMAEQGEARGDDEGEWQGWGTALKPAFEPIVLARKPLSEKTVAANVLRWRTGALNIDGCRIGTDGGTKGCDAGPSNGILGDGLNGSFGKPVPGLGRWPANVVHDGSDEVVGAFPAQAGGGFGKRGGNKNSTSYGFERGDMRTVGFGDSGSAARFFYSAKASKADRAGSKHPTVKPISLMQWLVRLVTPPDGTVLDPFAGSGTTGAAALAEGFNVILCEKEAAYIEDIKRRLGNVARLQL